jgi:hypothetical protein
LTLFGCLGRSHKRFIGVVVETRLVASRIRDLRHDHVSHSALPLIYRISVERHTPVSIA